jgi:hypothetical protein
VQKGFCGDLYESTIQSLIQPVANTLKGLVPQDKMAKAPKPVRLPLRYAAQLLFIAAYIRSVVRKAFSYSA